MITVTDIIESTGYKSRAFDMYFGGKKGAVLDIETTGLTPKRCAVILVGILTYDGDQAEAVQFFAESLSDEKEVLRATADMLKDLDYIVTYNGASFDIPFLKERARKKEIDFPDIFNLDLFTIVRKFSNIKDLTGSLRQKDVEQYLGIADERADEINGGRSVEMYYEYLNSHDPELQKFILLHNHDDICQLYRLLPVLKLVDLNAAMLSYGYPAGEFTVTNIKVSSSGLLVNAAYKGETDGYIAFPTEEQPYRAMIGPDGDTEIEFPSENIANGVDVIDAKRILSNMGSSQNADIAKGAPDIFRFPAFSSGYLILSIEGRKNALEINAFLKAFFEGLAYELI